MSPAAIGELCAGYGGLGMGVSRVIDAEAAWYSEIDKGALKVLEYRFPGVPNIGDMTTVDWSGVPRVDVLTGGTPCQDLSHAGKRAGMTEGTRSNLWVAMREAIAVLRPSLVVWENVGGAYSAAADSDLEQREGRLGDRPGRPALRALGRVLGDLASLGYVGGWHGLRAADVGAPHGRLRVFVVAHLADADRNRLRARCPEPPRWQGPRGGALLPTPSVADGEGGHQTRSGDRSGELLLPGVAQRLLATPRAFGSRTSRHAATTAYRRSAPSLEQQIEIAEGITPREIVGAEVQDAWRATWGDYAEAIARWEHLTRPAPEPTMLSRKGTPRLSPAFSEWMMGLPAGWVTDTPGITRNEALRALGNGVVPQQAAAAVAFLLDVLSQEVAA